MGPGHGHGPVALQSWCMAVGSAVWVASGTRMRENRDKSQWVPQLDKLDDPDDPDDPGAGDTPTCHLSATHPVVAGCSGYALFGSDLFLSL